MSKRKRLKTMSIKKLCRWQQKRENFLKGLKVFETLSPHSCPIEYNFLGNIELTTLQMKSKITVILYRCCRDGLDPIHLEIMSKPLPHLSPNLLTLSEPLWLCLVVLGPSLR